MHNPSPKPPSLLRLTLAAAILAAPGLAFGQTQAQGPSTGHPGTSQPGTSQPGTSQPGTSQPGTSQPGTSQPGTSQPGTARPMNSAADPARPSAIAPASPGAALTPPMTGGTSGAMTAMPGSVMAARPRMSQIIGSRIYNDRDQNVGEVDEILLTQTGPMAIIQVGGFLGLGGRLVSLPLEDLRWNAERERLMLPGATKEALETRPAFEYDANSRRR